MSEVEASKGAIEYAEEIGLDLATAAIEGSGPGGRIYKPDIEAFMEAQEAEGQDPNMEITSELFPVEEGFIASLRFTNGQDVFFLMSRGKGVYALSHYGSVEKFLAENTQRVPIPAEALEPAEGEGQDPSIPIPAQAVAPTAPAEEPAGTEPAEPASAEHEGDVEIEPQVQVDGEAISGEGEPVTEEEGQVTGEEGQGDEPAAPEVGELEQVPVQDLGTVMPSEPAAEEATEPAEPSE